MPCFTFASLFICYSVTPPLQYTSALAQIARSKNHLHVQSVTHAAQFQSIHTDPILTIRVLPGQTLSAVHICEQTKRVLAEYNETPD